MIFAWDELNLDHVGKHNVTPAEAEFVVENAASPFPQAVGEGKLRVWGATPVDRLLQVIYVLKTQKETAFESMDLLNWAKLERMPEARIARVIHATPDMKRQLRRRRR